MTEQDDVARLRAEIRELEKKVNDLSRIASYALSDAQHAEDSLKQIIAKLPGTPDWTHRLEAQVSLFESRLRVVEERVRQLWIRTFGAPREQND